MALVLARRRPLAASSLLAFPAGATPGFDPNHIVGSDFVTFSSVAVQGKNHINLLKGTPGTLVLSSNLATNFHSASGWGTSIGASENGGIQFPGVVPATNRSSRTQATLAAIFRINAATSSGFECFFASDDSNTSGYAINLGFNGSQRLALQSSNVNAVNTFGSTAFSVGVPYFVAISNYGNGVTSLAVIVNLLTGQTQTSTFSGLGLNSASTSGTYCVNNNGAGSGSSSDATVNATMLVERAMSLAELLIWSADPWSFWYPRGNLMNLVTTGGAAATFLAAWALGSNLPVIGTGNY